MYTNSHTKLDKLTAFSCRQTSNISGGNDCRRLIQVAFPSTVSFCYYYYDYYWSLVLLMILMRSHIFTAFVKLNQIDKFNLFLLLFFSTSALPAGHLNHVTAEDRLPPRIKGRLPLKFYKHKHSGGYYGHQAAPRHSIPNSKLY